MIDNTGVFRDDKELSRHLQAKGVDKVLLTAPAKGDVPNVVHGVNHETVDLKKQRIFRRPVAQPTPLCRFFM